MEYYYIDFRDMDIYSWNYENPKQNGEPHEVNAFDEANKLTNNFFRTYYEARKALHEIINKQDNQEGYKHLDYTNIKLGQLLSNDNEIIKRNAMSILKTLQK